MFCLDTYALIEITEGSEKFNKFLNSKVFITDITMAEFYGILYRKYGSKTADYWNRKLSPVCKSVSREILIDAVKFKIENNKQNLSFFDCVGYIFSQKNKLLFVTGDKEFREKSGVKFIQK